VDNPILVEVTRGPVVESRHRGAVAVVDADGRTVLAVGSVDDPVFPRSAVKAIQAVPLLESGIADRFGLTEAEIALACASHAGEPEHVATAAAMLARVGRDEACLECGAHWPLREEAVRALAAQGRAPTALHNNCSGKHAGFVCLACGLGEDPAGYVRPEHRVQREVRRALDDVTGAAHQAERCGIDGCSIPTYAVPLTALARGFARFGTGIGLSPSGAEAARRIRAAVARHPFMVAGTDQFDTRVMAALGERAFVKGGAEGVFCAAFPELGYGLALKIDDGGTRAAETAMANLVLRFLALADDERAAIAPLARPAVRNRNGFEVGRVRAAGPLV
jgi:L-asparaginase II